MAYRYDVNVFIREALQSASIQKPTAEQNLDCHA